ncbi:MAG TPA: hypothetical protein VGI74_13480 [Streptosporangiaceae bacterium]|jgi:hypothetical protein
MRQASVHIAEKTDTPGELMRLVAGGLAGNGYEASLPECDDGRCLSIASPAAQCALTVDDWGSVVLEWNPVAGSAVDPLEVADLASALLTGRAGLGQWESDGDSRPDLTLKGRVGRELRARGLQAELEVYPDEMAFEAHIEIVASDPGTDPDAEVRVADDGWLSWERDYGAEEAAICWEPGRATWIADPGKVAGDIVAAVTLALSHGLPSQADQQ